MKARGSWDEQQKHVIWTVVMACRMEVDRTSQRYVHLIHQTTTRILDYNTTERRELPRGSASTIAMSEASMYRL